MAVKLFFTPSDLHDVATKADGKGERAQFDKEQIRRLLIDYNVMYNRLTRLGEEIEERIQPDEKSERKKRQSRAAGAGSATPAPAAETPAPAPATSSSEDDWG